MKVHDIMVFQLSPTYFIAVRREIKGINNFIKQKCYHHLSFYLLNVLAALD